MFRLLFATFTKRAEKDTAPDENIKAIEIPRNFSNIWQKFPQYDETNTLMISNFYNLEQEFRRNDLVLPLFHPKLGQTDFLDDKHLGWTMNYIKYLQTLEVSVSDDIRQCMEHMSYPNYIRNLTR